MSSTHYLLCLSHDPAITIREISRDEVENVSRIAEALRDHPHCDVVVGRYSAALVEVGCLGKTLLGHTGCKGYHSGVGWAADDWLRLLLAATEPPNRVDPAILRPLVDRCWPLERLRRLSVELGYGNED